MIKRSFIGLIKPRMIYKTIELTPPEPEKIPVPKQATLLLNEHYDPFGRKNAVMLKKGDPIKTGQKLALYEDSDAYVVSSVTGTRRVGISTSTVGMLRKMKRLTNNFPPSQKNLLWRQLKIFWLLSPVTFRTLSFRSIDHRHPLTPLLSAVLTGIC